MESPEPLKSEVTTGKQTGWKLVWLHCQEGSASKILDAESCKVSGRSVQLGTIATKPSADPAALPTAPFFITPYLLASGAPKEGAPRSRLAGTATRLGATGDDEPLAKVVHLSQVGWGQQRAGEKTGAGESCS